MLHRVVILPLFTAFVLAIYDPSDDAVKPSKTTTHLDYHHNYSRVRVQRPNEPTPIPPQPDLVRVKRNKTRIEIHSKCPKGASGQFVYELSCYQFLNCWKGRGFVQNCAPGTLFNPKTLECDHAEKVQCVTGPRQSVLLHHHERLTEETQPGCPRGFSGIIPHYTNCTKFIICDRGRENVMDCGPGTVFNVNSNNCDYPHRARCVNQEDYVGDGYRVVRHREGGGRQQHYDAEHRGSSSSDSRGQYRPLRNTTNHYQDLTDNYGDDAYRGHPYRPTNQGQTFYDQNLESHSENTRPSSSHVSQVSGQRYGQTQNAGTSFGNHGDAVYDQNLNSYDQNLESSNSRSSNRYRSNQNVRTNFGNQDQNLESYDQHLEPSSTTYGERYRQTHNVKTNFENQGHAESGGSYAQNLEPSSSRGLNTEGQHYRPVQNVATNYHGSSTGYRQQDINSNSHSSASSTSYARAHQVNSYRPAPRDQDETVDGFDVTKRYRPYQNGHTTNQQQVDHDQYLESSSHHVYASTYPPYNGFQNQNEPPRCSEGGAGLYQHPYDCSKFLNCANGITYIQDCAPGTLFNPLLKICDFPYNVRCDQKVAENGQGQKPWNHSDSSISSFGSYDQNVYGQPNENYGHRQFGPREPVGGNVPSSSTRRPDDGYYSFDRPEEHHLIFGQDVNGQSGKSGGNNFPASSTRPMSGSNTSQGHYNMDAYEQTVYERQNKNYGHRPFGQRGPDGDNIPSSSTRRPEDHHLYLGQEVLGQSGKTAGNNVPASSTRPVSGSSTSQGRYNMNGYEQTVYEQQNKNYAHRPFAEVGPDGDNVPSSSTRRPSGNYYSSYRPETIYGNNEHRPGVSGSVNRPTGWSYTPKQPDDEETQGVIVQQTLYDGSSDQAIDGGASNVYDHQNRHGQWVAVEGDAPSSPTSRPTNGFYVTRQPQVLHTPRSNAPERNNKAYEVDYVYEYDDDIIVDVQPAASSKKQNTICRAGQYTCPDNHCISNFALCDGFKDCVNGSDENNCDISQFTLTKNNKLAVAEKKKIANTTTAACAKYCLEESSFQCRAFNFRKHDGVCYLLDRNIGLSGALIIYQIFDYYEMTSQTIDCTSLFNCPNKKCIPYSRLCDGQNDCGDRTDEKHCSAHVLGYTIRLAGSLNKHEGRIEVTALGKTGYVCDDQFGLRDADVVCRELGFDLGALEVKGNSYYAKELGNNTFYLMDDVSCLGNETSLRDCDFSGWGVHNCMPQEVVGVVCKTPEEKCKEGYWQCDNQQECLPLAFLCDDVYDCTDSSDEDNKHCEAPTELRLANGSTHLEGRVEIKHHGTWGTICDDDFNEDAAKVVCKYFGFEGGASVRKNGHFGPGKGPIWLDQVFCQGNESTVEECVHWDWGEHNCDHSEDVGVVCSERSVVEETERHRQEQIVELPRVEPLQLLPEECGLRKGNIFSRDDEVHFRVVKGSEAKRGDYPWQASIRVKGKSKPTHWCGAVVISQRFVLTAAHCLVGFSKGAYTIVAGDYHVDEDEGTEQVALIEDFYIHEDFRKGQKMNNDIALVKLKGNGFTITQDVQPICLPDADVKYVDGLNCTISGFGSTKSGKAFYSHVLRAGWIPLQARDVCKMPHIYGSSITEGMICAGFLDEGVDACDGDSGGPLACLHEGVFTLFGLTSWGQHCGYANKPGVYVKISHYRDWIEEKMRKYA